MVAPALEVLVELAPGLVEPAGRLEHPGADPLGEVVEDSSWSSRLEAEPHEARRRGGDEERADGAVGGGVGHVDEVLGLGAGERGREVGGRIGGGAAQALSRGSRGRRVIGGTPPGGARRGRPARSGVPRPRSSRARRRCRRTGDRPGSAAPPRPAACRAARPTARHRSSSSAGASSAPLVGQRSGTGTGRRAVARWWSSTLWWAIVNSHPRRFRSSCRRGYARSAAITVSWKQSGPWCGPAWARQKRWRSAPWASRSCWNGGSGLVHCAFNVRGGRAREITRRR